MVLYTAQSDNLDMHYEIFEIKENSTKRKY